MLYSFMIVVAQVRVQHAQTHVYSLEDTALDTQLFPSQFRSSQRLSIFLQTGPHLLKPYTSRQISRPRLLSLHLHAPLPGFFHIHPSPNPQPYSSQTSPDPAPTLAKSTCALRLPPFLALISSASRIPAAVIITARKPFSSYVGGSFGPCPVSSSAKKPVLHKQADRILHAHFMVHLGPKRGNPHTRILDAKPRVPGVQILCF